MKTPTQAAGEQTRLDILDTAEELFAQYGPQGVSIRSINAAAGVGSASIHYHFGSKEALVFAVLDRRGNGIVKRYAELLADFARQESPTCRDLIELFARPMIELLEQEPVRGFRWIKFAGHLAQSQDPQLRRATAGHPRAINQRFFDAVVRILPDLPPEAAMLRWQIASSAVMRLLASADISISYSDDGKPRGLSQQYVDTLLDFAAVGLAGASPATAKARGAGKSRSPADGAVRAIRQPATGSKSAKRKG